MQIKSVKVYTLNIKRAIALPTKYNAINTPTNRNFDSLGIDLMKFIGF